MERSLVPFVALAGFLSDFFVLARSSQNARAMVSDVQRRAPLRYPLSATITLVISEKLPK
jgi:hypothetical protein